MLIHQERFSTQSSYMPVVLASAADGIVDKLIGARGDPERAFEAVGLVINNIASPTSQIHLHQYCGLFEEAARETKDDNFGLRFGLDFVPERLGLLGYLAINSPTLYAAIKNIIAYFPAHQQSTRVELSQAAELATFSYMIESGSVLGKRQDAELSLGMFLNVFRRALGTDWSPLEIHFAHPKSADWREHRDLFDAPVYFGQPKNALLMHAGDLNRVMPNADHVLMRLIAAQLAARVETNKRPIGIVDRVRHLIEIGLSDGSCTLEKIANDCRLPVWTLQRQLSEIGTNFNRLLTEARHDLAVRYLKEFHLPVTEVALMLGYSETSAFSRAFRQWTGQSPSAYLASNAVEISSHEQAK